MKEVTENHIKEILESDFYLPSIKPMSTATRTHDDNDGDLSQCIRVTVDHQGDVWIKTYDEEIFGTLRFRMPMIGGGLSPRTRNALLILAYAINLDNAERDYQPR